MGTSDLKSIYSKMWTNSIDTFANNTCKNDLLINDPEDTRRGLTVLSYVSGSVAGNINNFLHELKRIEPDQYYYPVNELHLTILSIISCRSGFKLTDVNVDAYVSVFNQSINDIGGFTIKYQGITVSSSCILIQGFPDTAQLQQLRSVLRKNFKNSGLESTIDARYEISTAHTTAVRCLAPFQNSDTFTNVLKQYKNYRFGSFEVNSIDFVFNNWYQNLSITKKLASSQNNP